MALLDEDMTVTHVNKKLSEITGIPKKNIEGRKWTEFVSKDDLRRMKKYHVQRRKKPRQTPPSYGFTILGSKSRQIHVYGTISMIPGTKKSVASLIDVTEVKSVKKELHDAEKHYKSILDSMGDPIHVVDKNLKIQIANKAIMRWNREIGLPAKLEGKTLNEIYPFLPKKAVGEYKEVFKNGIPQVSKDKTRINGKEFWTETRKIPFIRQGKVDRVITIIRDITGSIEARRKIVQSEKKYRSLFESSRDPVYITSRSGRFLDVNPAAIKLFGYSRKKMLEMDVRDIYVNPKDRKKFQKDIEEKGFLVDYPLLFKKKSGENMQCLLTSSVRSDKSGKILGYQGIIRDMTRQKRMEDALRESQQFLSDIFSSILDGISVLDADLNILQVNPVMEKWYPHSLPLEGKKCYQAYHVRDKPCKACPTRKTLKSHKSEKAIVPLTGSKGEVNGWMELHSFPYVDSKTGKIKGVIEYVRDITEQKAANEALRDSEEKFRTLADQSPNMIFINRAGRIVYCNGKCEEVMGYSKNEFLSPKFNFMDLIHEDSVSLIRENFKNHSKGMDIPPYEYLLRTRGGETLTCLITTKLIEFEGQQAILGIITDISEQKKSRELLRKSEERYRGLVETQNDMIARLDTSKKPTFANDALTKKFGLKRENLEDVSFQKLFHEEDEGKFSQAVKKLSKKPFRSQLEARNKTCRGLRWIAWEFYAIRDDSGGTGEIQCVGKDVTQMRSAQQSLKKYTKKLEQANKKLEKISETKSEFISIASHELKTPLAIIKGYADILSSCSLGALNDKQADKIKRISENVGHLSNLVDVMLDLSLIELGELNLQMRRTDLSLLLEEILEDMQIPLQRKKITLKKRVGKKIIKKADRERIKEVFTNLLDNAIKYTPVGGQIRVSLSKGRKTRFRIKDSGIGIPKKDLEEIFRPFASVDYSKSRRHGGVGLGLTITRQIIMLHGGDIKVESEIGEGTTFIIEL